MESNPPEIRKSIFLWYKQKSGHINVWEPFPLNQLELINEAYQSGKQTFDLGNEILSFYSMELEHKQYPLYLCPVKWLLKFYGKKCEFQTGSTINPELIVLNEEFGKLFKVYKKEFFYASLYGLLRAAEIKKYSQDLLVLPCKRAKVFKNFDFQIYLKITGDESFNVSQLYEQYLLFLEQKDDNKILDKLEKKKKSKDKNSNFGEQILEIYHLNPRFFRDYSDKTVKKLMAPYYWLMGFKRFFEYQYGIVYVGCQLTKEEIGKYKSILYTKERSVWNDSYISASAQKDIAGLFGNTIFEIRSDKEKFCLAIDTDEFIIPSNKLFKINEIEEGPNHTIIKLELIKRVLNENEPKDSSIAVVRMKEDVKEMTLFAYEIVEEDFTHLKIMVPGLGIYKNGLFQIDFKVCPDYPFSPPQIKFDTKILHPNINEKTGIISNELLNEIWSPAFTCEKLLLKIQGLLENPVFDKMFENLINYRDNKEAFCKEAIELVEKYADKRVHLEKIMGQRACNEMEAMKVLLGSKEMENINK